MTTSDPGPPGSSPTDASSSAGHPARAGSPSADDRGTRAGTAAGGGPGPDDAFPVPHGPRTTGAGGHLLGVLIGLVLTAAALVLLTLGQSRIVATGVGGESVSPDPLGITLVAVGAVLTALVALLAVRSSAIPFTGGLLAVAVGAAYLFAPVRAHGETVRLLATGQNRDAVLTLIGVATSGTVFAVGLVLLATGTAASLVRRRGIEVGSFRERTSARAPGRR